MACIFGAFRCSLEGIAINEPHDMPAMIETPEGYAPQKPETLSAYLSGIDAVRRILGGMPEQWTIAEVGDGNLNLVFIVKGPEGGVAVKQALPYVRLVGESWPLPLSRAHYEHMALTEQARLTGALVPKIHHYDERQALIVMELLEPHIIMRRGMIAATAYPKFADDISTFMARTLYFTSDLALTADRKKALIAAFAGNTALCKITEDLIFTDPYRVAELNRWTSPQLDAYAAQRQAWGHPLSFVTRAEILAREPNLRDVPDHAFHVAEEGMLEPLATSQALLAAATALGAEVLTGSPVKWLERGDRVTGVMTDDGVIHADETLVAAGVHTDRLLDSVGITLKLTSTRNTDTPRLRASSLSTQDTTSAFPKTTQ
jgi:hypothetical protein